MLRFLIATALLAAPYSARAEAAQCPQLDYALDAPPPAADGQLVLTADQVLMEQGGLSSLGGAVRLTQDGKTFSADALDYDEAQQRVRVKVQSLFRNRDLVIKSREAEFDLTAERGAFLGTEFSLLSRGARGVAEEIALNSDGTVRLAGMSYTTCAPGNEAWMLDAGELRFNYDEGLGTARNVRVEFGGVPIFYTPYFQFPIDGRRRTGLLFPTFGESEQTGADIRWPVYLNLAPNYDATLTPRLMSRRGVQLGSDFRYLLDRSQGRAEYDYLNRDKVTGDTRAYFSFEHQGLINRRLSLDARFGDVSDRAYFEDLGDDLELASITHLERSARLIYQAPAAYTIQVLAQDYQTVASNLALADEPYRRLPQIRLDAINTRPLFGTRLGIGGEYVNFSRNQSVQGQRVDVLPYLRMEHERAWWYTALQGDMRYTSYQLTNTTPGQNTQPERVLSGFSAEGGLRFERLSPGGALQTLEPRLMYLYVPFVDQDDLPLFDSGEPDFDFTQLFARNRFSGEDRVSDANHIVLAATSRLLDPVSGFARWSASVGQLYRLERPRVQLPGSLNTPSSGATDFIASLDYRMSQRWSGSLSSQWSPDGGEFDRAAIAARYRDSGRRFDIAYRYRQAILEQADLALSTPLSSSWRIAGRWRYSLQDDATLDNIVGLEYETCCWALRGSYRRFIANTAGEFNSGIYLQLELKGLTRFGTGVAGLLPMDEGAPDAHQKR